MSRDSSCTYIHMHSARFADIFEVNPAHFTLDEESLKLTTHTQAFNTSFADSSLTPSNSNGTVSNGSIAQHTTTNGVFTHIAPPKPPAVAASALSSAASYGSHIPFEDIYVPPQHQPPNPEDEDDVVPDQHAAFGITKAMQLREGRERAWRDFDSLRGLVRGDDLGRDGMSSTLGGGVGLSSSTAPGAGVSTLTRRRSMLPR